MAEKKTTKKYKFRKFKSTDLFMMTKLIKKVGINHFAELFSSKEAIEVFKGEDNKDEQLGFMILSVGQLLIERIDSAEKEIFDILSATSNLTVEEIQDLDLITFTDMVFDFVKKDDFMGFFNHVMALLKKMKQ